MLIYHSSILFVCTCVFVCEVPVLMEYGGLRRLLHLSELVETMMVYCMLQRAPLSTQ